MSDFVQERRAMVESIMKKANTLHVEHIWLSIVDIHGITRSKCVPVEGVEDFLENGFGMCMLILDSVVHGDITVFNQKVGD